MSKRYGHLYEQLDRDALHRAYLRSRQGKRSLPSTLAFEQNLGANIEALFHELHDGTYQIQPYRKFQVHEPKTRDICAPTFRDRIVQHALYEILYPIFDRTFIHDSYGCRVGKGTHKAADQAQRFLRESRQDSYYLQLDIKKFYYSINRRILREQLARKIKDQRFLDLSVAFTEQDDPLGLPIGNLLSQLFALIYLDAFDQWVKRDLKIKRYVRYVDDSILFDLDRQQAQALRDEIAEWLWVHLELRLSRHTIAPIKRGFNFVGFRTWRSRRFVRKRSLYQFSRSLKNENIASLNAIMGHAKNTATLAHFRRRVYTEKPDLAILLTHAQDHPSRT